MKEMIIPTVIKNSWQHRQQSLSSNHYNKNDRGFRKSTFIRRKVWEIKRKKGSPTFIHSLYSGSIRIEWIKLNISPLKKKFYT